MTVSVAGPIAKEFAGIVIVALPEASVAGEEVGDDMPIFLEVEVFGVTGAFDGGIDFGKALFFGEAVHVDFGEGILKGLLGLKGAPL